MYVWKITLLFCLVVITYGRKYPPSRPNRKPVRPQNVKMQQIKAPMVQFLANGSLPISDNKNKPISSHIISGVNVTSLTQTPWQVGLNITRSKTSFFCGGSLIHANWVISAAHCTFQATKFEVRFGSLYPTSGGVLITSITSYTHPNYNSLTLNNDIGLIYLPQPAPLSSVIKVIPIVASTVTNFSPLLVSGWGKTTDKATFISANLQIASVRAISNNQCISTYGSTIITANSLCAVGNPLQSPCQGDSGGPLFINITNPSLVGVVSFVASTGCQQGLPSGFIRPANYRSWLTSITKLNF